MNHAAPSSASATSTPEFSFSCHGMARDEFLSCVASKRFRGTVNDGLSATEVRHQGLRRQRWTETVNQIEDGDHRRREHHKIAVAHCVRRIRSAAINTAVLCALRTGARSHPTDSPGKPLLLQS